MCILTKWRTTWRTNRTFALQQPPPLLLLPPPPLTTERDWQLEPTMFPDVKSEANNNPDEVYDKSPGKCEKNGNGKVLLQNGGMFPLTWGREPKLLLSPSSSHQRREQEYVSVPLPLSRSNKEDERSRAIVAVFWDKVN
ncbi:hypothetical protein F7725_018906 [Dissostichus mawsoni]|uniref:Uncharacterized protein n=1 Tax=Dissostichus mawsoni TaxID=36200 RepID=A0A7J5XUM5_DISMA|nr:hypothetical protein F7725_018906 [Dissostichus mawsoni]